MSAIGLSITSIVFILGKVRLKVYCFAQKETKKYSNLDIKYGTMHIKQYHTVTYLGCFLKENVLGESMPFQVIKKMNTRLRFLHGKNRFLSQHLRRPMCNAIIQPHFDYARSSWYPKLNKNLRKKLITISV